MYTIKCDKTLEKIFSSYKDELLITDKNECNINVLSALNMSDLADESEIYIINSDDLALERIVGELNGYVISCGMKNNATITASSIDVDTFSFTMCIQRAITGLNGSVIEPQEIPLINIHLGSNINTQLLVAATKIICGIDIKKNKH